jgi:hypothetical protein
MSEAKKKKMDVKRTVDPACLEVLTKNEEGRGLRRLLTVT